LDTEAQSNVEKQKPELVNTYDDAPNPLGMISRMVGDNDDDEMQYRLITKRIFSKDNTATDHEDASQAQEAQGMAVQSHQERNDQPQSDRAVESYDLQLLEATLVEEPSEVEVQPVGPIYDAIYVIVYDSASYHLHFISNDDWGTCFEWDTEFIRLEKSSTACRASFSLWRNY
jgi:hypothetical protein